MQVAKQLSKPSVEKMEPSLSQASTLAKQNQKLIFLPY
jgi:hypothetical protein